MPRFPWIVLIPRVEGARELEDLAEGERDVLMEEILRAGDAARAVSLALGRRVEKLNVGQLGNVTPQLHVHVVGRRADDAAWPGPSGDTGRRPPTRRNSLPMAWPPREDRWGFRGSGGADHRAGAAGLGQFAGPRAVIAAVQGGGDEGRAARREAQGEVGSDALDVVHQARCPERPLAAQVPPGAFQRSARSTSCRA
jgi:diadenosine tetraphosphate (Ap4A) HIT family hydrolase